ncbi:MAG: hypothetical protein ABSC94_17350 [Polyangiaceae bacterium]|jgi:hypothetical protein
MNDQPVRHDSGLPPEKEVRITNADLRAIDQISALLATLNDPRAGADALARHVEAIPALKHRIAVRFARRVTSRGRSEVAAQIALLGNRVLESILLELLEDLVTLASETRASGARR